MLVRYTVDEVRGLVSDAKARLVVTDEGTIGKAVAACQGLQVDFLVKRSDGNDGISFQAMRGDDGGVDNVFLNKIANDLQQQCCCKGKIDTLVVALMPLGVVLMSLVTTVAEGFLLMSR